MAPPAFCCVLPRFASATARADMGCAQDARGPEVLRDPRGCALDFACGGPFSNHLALVNPALMPVFRLTAASTRSFWGFGSAFHQASSAGLGFLKALTASTLEIIRASIFCITSPLRLGLSPLNCSGSNQALVAGPPLSTVVMFRPGPEAAKPRLFGSASRARAEPTWGPEPAFGPAWHSSRPRPSRKAAAFREQLLITSSHNCSPSNLPRESATGDKKYCIPQMYSLRCTSKLLRWLATLYQIVQLSQKISPKPRPRPKPGRGRAGPGGGGLAWDFQKPKPPKPGRSPGFQAEPRPEHH
ncbi:hypothetical protein C8R45DRAFT_934492 [Mycena sanguinolenta]|nr:hypothetical protein C8R45DRAFT_934492 [Mycena sanguinolenta]